MVPKFIKKSSVSKEEIIIYTYPQHLISLLTFLKDHTNSQYKMLVDITAVDFPENEERFEVVYFLLSVKYNSRIIIKVAINEMSNSFASISFISFCIFYKKKFFIIGKLKKIYSYVRIINLFSN